MFPYIHSWSPESHWDFSGCLGPGQPLISRLVGRTCESSAHHPQRITPRFIPHVLTTFNNWVSGINMYKSSTDQEESCCPSHIRQATVIDHRAPTSVNHWYFQQFCKGVSLRRTVAEAETAQKNRCLKDRLSKGPWMARESQPVWCWAGRQQYPSEVFGQEHWEFSKTTMLFIALGYRALLPRLWFKWQVSHSFPHKAEIWGVIPMGIRANLAAMMILWT